jgi:ankyrin repeat protein
MRGIQQSWSGCSRLATRSTSLPAAPTRPFVNADETVVRNGDLDVARRLLDLGAAVEGGASKPWSSLEPAVLNNRVDVARLFLERGANVNFSDKAGYTSLLLAASIDFGETTMIDLLLAGGARVEVKNREGQDRTRPRA